MNVLSLFDGISCGQLALQRAGITYDKYFASEINHNAIKICRKNFPDTIHLGDVTKWESWDLPEIGLLIGGSPCTGFSVAGKMLNFDDPQSRLFWEYVSIRKHYKPKYFMLENVCMKREFADIITEQMGVDPVVINSSIFSAQDRKRMYWTNIPMDTLPSDRGILLKDIMDDRSELPVDESVLRSEIVKFTSRNYVLNYNKNGRIRVYDPKNGSNLGEVGSICTTEGKSVCITASHVPKIYHGTPVKVRELTVTEAGALQTLPSGYLDVEGVSDRQKYMAVGNGWTVNLIAHIFKNLKTEEKIMETEVDVFEKQGAGQCVEKDVEVNASGNLTSVENLVPGDNVETSNGTSEIINRVPEKRTRAVSPVSERTVYQTYVNRISNMKITVDGIIAEYGRKLEEAEKSLKTIDGIEGCQNMPEVDAIKHKVFSSVYASLVDAMSEMLNMTFDVPVIKGDDIPPGEHVNAAQAAKMYGCSSSAMLNWFRTGVVKGYVNAHNGRHMILKSDIERLIEKKGAKVA